MPKLTPAQLNKAVQRFLTANPAAAAPIQSLTQADADFMETSLDELRLQRTIAEIDKLAHEKGCNNMELLFSLVAETAAEFRELCEERQAAINRHLGL